jgi:hypothetical protein
MPATHRRNLDNDPLSCGNAVRMQPSMVHLKRVPKRDPKRGGRRGPGELLARRCEPRAGRCGDLNLAAPIRGTCAVGLVRSCYWFNGEGFAGPLRSTSLYRGLDRDIREPLLNAIAERVRTRMGTEHHAVT